VAYRKDVMTRYPNLTLQDLYDIVCNLEHDLEPQRGRKRDEMNGFVYRTTPNDLDAQGEISLGNNPHPVAAIYQNSPVTSEFIMQALNHADQLAEALRVCEHVCRSFIGGRTNKESDLAIKGYNAARAALAAYDKAKEA
jgi:hypothetical protein